MTQEFTFATIGQCDASRLIGHDLNSLAAYSISSRKVPFFVKGKSFMLLSILSGGVKRYIYYLDSG